MKQWLLAVGVALHGGLIVCAETSVSRNEGLQDNEHIMTHLKENEAGKGATSERLDDGKQAYHYAQKVCREHSIHTEDGIPCDWDCHARIVAVHVDKTGKENWIDKGAVIEASVELMNKIQTFSVKAPMCGIDPQNGKPVPAVLIKEDTEQ